MLSVIGVVISIYNSSKIRKLYYFIYNMPDSSTKDKKAKEKIYVNKLVETD